jgi:hypothetical protein
MFTFLFYDWLVLTRPWLYKTPLDLNFCKALILTSTVGVADTLPCVILGFIFTYPQGSIALLTYESILSAIRTSTTFFGLFMIISI